jgi:hypothetical protein
LKCTRIASSGVSICPEEHGTTRPPAFAMMRN